MHILDRELNQVIFTELQDLLNLTPEKEGLQLVKALAKIYIENPAFRQILRKIKFRHHKRKLALLQILAQKQNLEVERKVFQIVRETIQIENFHEEIGLLNLYLAFIFRNNYKYKINSII